MSKAKRKPLPSPPSYAWLDLDGCWFCKNRNNCGSCKIMKKYAARAEEKRNRKKWVNDLYE